MSYQNPELFIAGRWLTGEGRETSPILNPATGSVIADLPHATAADLDRALESAQRGFQLWRQRSGVDRSRVLQRASELIRERVESIAYTITLENGKPLNQARVEIGSVADLFEYYAGEARRAYGRILPPRGAGQRLMVLKQPIGPVAAFSPWNFPAQTTGRKLVGALAAGCSCIIKPAEETPGACIALVQACIDAGVPDDVLNIVFGAPANISAHLIASTTIAKISFTGSTAVGKQLMRLAAANMTRMTMELGGHSPMLVFEDTDARAIGATTVERKFRNAGQSCTTPSRIYVHTSVYEPFLDSFLGGVKQLKVGNGLDTTADMGPLANERRILAMEHFVADARRRGAVVATGGHRLEGKGFFYAPTVLTDVPPDAEVMNLEPFGPIVSVVRFETYEAVITAANRLRYGLAAYAFTHSLKRATALSEDLQAGVVGINNFNVNPPEGPFGGLKESGYGLEGGLEGLDAYMDTKFINQS
jgi:succinate-semialdehyde dehydrogenase/glutarate-semialdehyde dehydrogenase